MTTSTPDTPLPAASWKPCTGPRSPRPHPTASHQQPTPQGPCPRPIGRSLASHGDSTLEEITTTSPDTRDRRRECITSPDIIQWGPLAPLCAPPSHLPFPKGTKITLQWDPPEAILTIPQEPLVWCKMAMSLPHPARSQPELPPALQAAILQEAQTPIPALARARSEAIQDIHKLRLASKSEEACLRETLDGQVASVTKTKQSLILQQLLDRHHYPDRRIGQELREGFPLTPLAAAERPLAHRHPAPDPHRQPAFDQRSGHHRPQPKQSPRRPYRRHHGKPPRKKSPTAGFACNLSSQPHTLSLWSPPDSESSRRTRSAP